MRSLVALLVLLGLCARASGRPQDLQPSAELLPGVPSGFYDEFGISVALDGERVAIGARGSEQEEYAYVFARRGDTWVQEARVGGFAFSEFGLSVGLSGDRMAVGAPQVCGPGSCRVYHATGGVWELEAELRDQAPGFGHDVALRGDTLLVGACGSQSAVTRSAFVYMRKRSGWNLEAVLRPADPHAVLDLGDLVVLREETALVGGHVGSGSDFHAAFFVFQHEAGQWKQRAVVAQPETDGRSLLAGLDLAGSRVVTSVWTEAEGPGLFAYQRSGRAWRPLGRIPVVVQGQVQMTFPEANVALHGDHMVAISPDFDQDPAAGLGLLFQRTSSGFRQVRTLVRADAEPGDGFGAALALNGNRVAIGAPFHSHEGLPSGAVYVYELAPGGPRAPVSR